MCVISTCVHCGSLLMATAMGCDHGISGSGRGEAGTKTLTACSRLIAHKVIHTRLCTPQGHSALLSKWTGGNNKWHAGNNVTWGRSPKNAVGGHRNRSHGESTYAISIPRWGCRLH